MSKNKEMEQLEEKVAMLVQTNRMNNLIDLMAVISDNIEMMNDDAIEKVIKKVDGAATAAFMAENAVKFAKRELSKGKEYTSVFQLLGILKDPDVARGLSFTIHMLRGLGKQI